MPYAQYLQRVKAYTSFYTVDELDKSTLALSEKYPNIVHMFIAGYSTKGHPIYCLKIGEGPRNALAFGCPHPNEPIGAMMLESFSALLAENQSLRDELGFTWYIIKTIDPDGTKLNEGWFKGPYTVYHYARNYFRPAMNRQAEWTFPIEYKKMNFQSPTEETRILMELIEKIKPRFMYSLHNAGFGGVFWYISKEMPEIYKKLAGTAEKYEIPLSMGEPEVPCAKVYSPAVYELISTRQMYDFYEKQMPISPEQLINWGTSSDDYANRFADTFTLVSELPYFFDPRIADMTESDMLRRDAVIESCALMEELLGYIIEQYNGIISDISMGNPFRIALGDFVKCGGPAEAAAKKRWAETAPELLSPAKNSEIFDNFIMSRFYHLLLLGLLVRMPEYELQTNTDDGSMAPARITRLEKAHMETESYLKKLCGELESKLNYEVIPIKKLISIQMESAFIAVEQIKKGDVQA